MRRALLITGMELFAVRRRRLNFMFIFNIILCTYSSLIFRITLYVISSTSNTKGDPFPFFEDKISRKWEDEDEEEK